MNAEGRPTEAPHDHSITLADDRIIVADPERRVSLQERHRQRQIQRLAAIQLVLAAYGVELRLVPPGPESCPPGCGYCKRMAVVA
jgi:uncharacterized protein